MEIRQNVIDDLNAMTTESWRTIRIMAEMVQALDTLNKLGTNCVSIFGSARSTSDTPEYRDAERLSRMLVEKGFGVITGGGPGRATQSVAINIYEEAFRGNIRYGYATAKSTVLFIIVLAVTAVRLRITGRKEQEL